MDHSFLSAFILLLLVLDPFGSLPIYISVMGRVAPTRRRIVALRELLLAFMVLLLFMFTGEGFLSLMRLSERSLEVAGGVILLMVAIRMIFSGGGAVYGEDNDREPMLFPLAVPLLAGPSAMATVLAAGLAPAGAHAHLGRGPQRRDGGERGGAAGCRPPAPRARGFRGVGGGEAHGPGAHRDLGRDDPGRAQALFHVGTCESGPTISSRMTRMGRG